MVKNKIYIEQYSICLAFIRHTESLEYNNNKRNIICFAKVILMICVCVSMCSCAFLFSVCMCVLVCYCVCVCVCVCVSLCVFVCRCVFVLLFLCVCVSAFECVCFFFLFVSMFVLWCVRAELFFLISNLHLYVRLSVYTAHSCVFHLFRASIVDIITVKFYQLMYPRTYI